MSHYYTVIMAGGRGERFWPLSRQAKPKHLLSIVGDRPMVAQTVVRLGRLVPPSQVFILTNHEHAAAVQAACPEVPVGQIVGEPMGRDTAAVGALAALLVRRRDPQGVLALLPADAAIHDAHGFQGVLQAAFATAADSDAIVTIGVKPSHPATGYGYLRRGAMLGQSEKRPWYRVEKFVEKPDQATAQRYLAEGVYLWNAGMFVVRAAVLEAAVRAQAPDLAAGMDKIAAALDRGVPLAQCLAEIYPTLPRISLDYAVMEKAPNVATFEAAFDWDDVGEWPALARHLPADAQGNVARGDVVVHAGRGNVVLGEPGHLITVLGADDLVIVHTPDATLVCPKSRAQDLKKLLQEVSAKSGGQRWL
jgi:mannose-1-phosphate guanylyltransferase